jgi:hypothetical protein
MKKSPENFVELGERHLETEMNLRQKSLNSLETENREVPV